MRALRPSSLLRWLHPRRLSGTLFTLMSWKPEAPITRENRDPALGRPDLSGLLEAVGHCACRTIVPFSCVGMLLGLVRLSADAGHADEAGLLLQACKGLGCEHHML